MARTARNYRDVHRRNLKATRAARRSKARAYAKNYKLPKPMFLSKPKRGRSAGRFGKGRSPGQPGFGWAHSGPRTTHRYPVKKGPRFVKSKIMKRLGPLGSRFNPIRF